MSRGSKAQPPPRIFFEGKRILIAGNLTPNQWQHVVPTFLPAIWYHHATVMPKKKATEKAPRKIVLRIRIIPLAAVPIPKTEKPPAKE